MYVAEKVFFKKKKNSQSCLGIYFENVHFGCIFKKNKAQS